MDIKKRLLTYPVIATVLGASIYFSANTYFNFDKYSRRFGDFNTKISDVFEPLPSDTIRVRLSALQLSENHLQVNFEGVNLEGYVLEGPGNGRFRRFNLTNRPGINAFDLRNFALSLGSLIDIKPTTKSVLDGTNSVIYPDEVSSKKFTHDYNSRLKIRSYLSGFFGGD